LLPVEKISRSSIFEQSLPFARSVQKYFVYEKYCIPGRETVPSDRNLPMIRRDELFTTSGSENNPNRVIYLAEAIYCRVCIRY
jgi:hypothetical protein